ncbi:MAG: permease [Dehalococcoidia bacterium]|nr:permease [Dehalococcoidia bacterium]
MVAQGGQAATQRRGGYYLSLAAFAASVALLLFTVVDIRRAFLFPAADYFRVGSPSTILSLDARHVPLLALGILGAWLAYGFMVRLERRLKGPESNLSTLARLLAVVIGVLLVADLFIYRGVPAARIAETGKLAVGQAIPPYAFQGWLLPLGQGLNYMALVWHATALGILLGALFLCVGQEFLTRLLGGKGFKAHVAGVVLAVPQPFCSCCAAPVGAALYRGGASLGPTLAFVVSSPMLNPTALILATLLLPGEYALLRIAGGLAVGVLLTYVVSLVASRWVTIPLVETRPNRLAKASTRLLEGYARLFRFGDDLGRVVDSPANLVSSWLSMAWKLARVVVPVLLVSSVVTAAIVMALPLPSGNLLGVIAAAAFGTLLMVPTWTEIPIAAGLIKEGLSGPAAALLLTLPAVSVPGLAIVAGAVRSLRVALLLGLSIFVAGVGAGVLFLGA